MIKQQLFQYAVLLHSKEMKDGKEVFVGSDIIVDPKFMTARNEKDVVFKVTRMISEDHAKNPDNVEILVRNF